MSALPNAAESVSLRALLQDECEVPVHFERKLGGMQLDSRRVKPGDLFVACKGAVADGRDFIPAAIAGGASAILVEADELWSRPQESGAVPLIPVIDLPRKLGRVAARFHGEPARQLRLVGVTGTNGKTTCSQLLAQALARLGHRCGVIGTLGHGLVGEALSTDPGGPSTTPDAVRLQQLFRELLAAGGDTVVMEVSSHGLDQHRVDVDDFSMAVFTNLSRDHLDYHGSMDAYGAAKLKLFTGARLRIALLNQDDPFSAHIRAALPAHTRALTWSLHDRNADIYAMARTHTREGLLLQVMTPWGSGQFKSPLLGSFNADNLLAVLGAVLACEEGLPEFSFERCLAVVGELLPVAGRMELVAGDYPVAVVVDYAHTPEGLRSALLAVREHFPGILICVFGCGGDRDPGKRPLMAKVAEQHADRIIVTDDNPRNEASAQIIGQILAGLADASQVRIEPDRARAIAAAIDTAPAGAIVLIAGKGHETYQDIRGQRHAFSDVLHAQDCLRRRFPEQTGK